MNALASSMLMVGVLLLGIATDVGRNAPAAVDHDRPLVQRSHAELDETLSAVVDEYCVRCHNDRRLTGNMSLEAFDVATPEADGELAERVIHKLRAGMMPPSGARRPPEDTLALLATRLENTLDDLARKNPNPGYRTFQRLNRAEYEAAIRGMFQIDIDASAFLPTETVSENFDNIADVQMLSATVLEGYLRAAAQVSRIIVGDANAPPATTSYKIPKLTSQVGHIDGTPLGTRGGIAVTHNFPADGDYIFELDLHSAPGGELFGRNEASGAQIEVSINGERVALLDLDRWMTETDPTGTRIETQPTHVLAGPQRVAAAFIQRHAGPVLDLIRPTDFKLADPQMGIGYGVTSLPHIRDLAISGPFAVTGISATPARARVFSCRPTSPDEARPCGEQIIASLAEEAYRRPLDGDDLPDLMIFFDQGREEGGFEGGVRLALQAMLASPHFVFRLEETPPNARPGEVYRISDTALASRLSFFLWGAPPDRELLRVAAEGDLSNTDELERQTRRMLADPRAESLATRFASQWLRLQDLEKILPDAQLYPLVDEQLKVAMRRETELFFDYIVQEDRSVLDLLTADYTFVNERLAQHYDLPGVTGSTMQRAPLLDERRRGLLGHGSILMMTSHGNRTSPVLRGKWVMEVLLGSPPPPPPPNVPPFDETAGADNGRQLTTRERMEMHRKNPACVSCHRVIDPLGLALDNFDVTGAWRIKESLNVIDASGELYDGTAIDGPVGLRNAIMKRSSVFVRTFARNLMAYALGRRVEYYDMPTIREIESDAAENGNRMSSFILGVVKSPAFRFSRVEAVADDGVAYEK